MEITPATRKKILDAASAVERDLMSNVSVDDLCTMAGMSDKHFQRCFKQVIGEAPKQFVRRLKLQAAAYYLKWSDATVLRIGSHVGYATHAGFTKAFQKQYGMTPQSFREKNNVTPYLHSPSRTNGFSPAELQSIPLTVRIEDMPTVRLATMRYIGPTEKMASIWKKMLAWAEQRGVLTDSSMLLGIHNDYWDELAEDRYRYDAAISVPDGFVADDEVSTMILESGPVAMCEFEGSVSEMDRQWRRFVEQWLPVSGYVSRTGIAFDRYPPELLSRNVLRQIIQAFTGVRATLCLPVRR